MKATKICCFRPVVMLAALSASCVAMAGVLTIAQEPLGTGSGATVKPNLWFVLDNSGSMDWTYLPDYVYSLSSGETMEHCQKDMSNPIDAGQCKIGDVPYMAAGFNKSYYDPAIQYKPPVKPDKTSFGNANWEKALSEPYIQYKNNLTTAKGTDSQCYTTTDVGDSGARYCDLKTQFPRLRWCTDTTYTNCRENTNAYIAASGRPYAYPDGTYKYGILSYGTPYYYVMTGSPVWCNSDNFAAADCSGTKWAKATYKYAKFSGNSTPVAGVGATAYLEIKKAQRTSTTTSSKVTKIEIRLSTTSTTIIKTLFSGEIPVTGTDSPLNRNNLAVQLVANMNNSGYAATQTVSCTASSPSTCYPKIKVTAPWADTLGTDNAYYNGKAVKLSVSDTTNIQFTANPVSFSGGVNKQVVLPPAAFARVDIVATTPSGYALDPATGKTYTTRKDCDQSATGCTYEQERQNFANWYSYYRGRMLMMKASLSLALENVSDTEPSSGFRIGFTTINSASSFEKQIKNFDSTQKDEIYKSLFSINPGSGTPLRQALSKAGEMYRGNLSVLSVTETKVDPVLVSCQPNFTFLASDGYWNGAGPVVSVGNTDDDSGSEPTTAGSGNPDPYPYKDDNSASDSLADIARYYYQTDLRPTMKDDVPAVKNTDELLKGSDSMYQHMKTFTMGLGINGTLDYDPSYSSGGWPVYENLKTGTTKWPKPLENEPTAIDDLWHAAVNGHGLYFSAATPTQVIEGLEKTLELAGQKTGSAAAAATSNLEPVAGDNFAYVASYRTMVWDGELEAKEINLTSGELATTAAWGAQKNLDELALAGGRKLYSAYKEAVSDTYVQMNLTWGNIVSRGVQSYFAPRQISYCGPTDADVLAKCPGATDSNLFDYLIGKPDATNSPNSYRERTYTAGSDTGTHVLGDIVSTQPVYVKKPQFGYNSDAEDSGYLDFVGTQSGRTGIVYVSANDGFLHAFNASSGVEEWAYAPSGVLPKLWKLADKNYAHTYFADGPITVGDVNAGGWKTILVGGMGGGGKNFFALDVTNPLNPQLLWEFTDADMGYTYGNPIITKRMSDNKWVVLLTSGYNNHATNQPAACTVNCGLGGDGKGYLYVLDATTGAVLNKISTGSGGASEPSGLSKISNWVDDAFVNNKTQYVYGGDLNGDLWRFDITDGTVLKLAAVGRPITTRPEAALVDGSRRAVFFGTGLFLQTTDRNDILANDKAIYGIKDEGRLINAGSLVPRKFEEAGAGRTITGTQDVDWSSDDGWIIPLPDPGERVNVDPKIQLGTLVIPSNVPDPDASGASCSVGGYGWINMIDYRQGSYVKNSNSNAAQLASSKIAKALVVGVNIVRLPDGKVVAITTTADNKHPVSEVPLGTENVKPRRISWRELTNN